MNDIDGLEVRSGFVRKWVTFWLDPYKFKIHRQEVLLAYELEKKQRLLLALGVHENLYQKLKRI